MIQTDATLAQLQQEMQELSRIFTGFRRLLHDGHPIDLTGVDGKVKDFCARVEAAEIGIRQQMYADFQALLELLESLETELRAARDRVTQ